MMRAKDETVGGPCLCGSPPRGRWFAGRVPRPSPTGRAPTKRFTDGLACITACMDQGLPVSVFVLGLESIALEQEVECRVDLVLCLSE